MAAILQNSIIGKFVLVIWTALQQAVRCSTLQKTAEELQKSYAHSRCKRVWEWFCGTADPACDSIYGRVLHTVEYGIVRFGNSLRKSFFYRVLCGIRDFYFKVTAHSRIFGLLNRLSLHQWFLAAFAFYLPIEYIIRDVLGIAILASVWEELFIAAAIALIFWRIALQQSEALQRESCMGLYILLFMGVGFLLMTLVCPWPSIAFAGYRAQVEYLVWFFLILRLVENERDFHVLYGAFLLMAAILSLHGIYQYIIGVEIPSSWVTSSEAGVRTRVFSLTGSPNIFGSLLVLSAPLAAGLIYYVKNAWAKVAFLALTGMMCLCLLFTFSRGAWVGLVVAVILFSLYVDRRLLLLMAAAIAAILAAVPSILNRLTFLFTNEYAVASSVGGRALRWETGRILLHDNNPWLGFGLGRFGGAVAMNNQVLDQTEEFEYFYMDNYYLKTMVEMGYIGIFFYLVMIIALIVWGFRAVYRSGMEPLPANLSVAMGQKNGFAWSFPADRSADPLIRNAGNLKILAASIFSGLCGVLVHCYFENIFEEPYMMAYFWGLAAMLLYCGFFRKSRACEKTAHCG